MLTPRRSRRPLMPQDREIMRLLDIGPTEYREFLDGADRLMRMEAMRSGPKALIFGALAVSIMINLAIGAALTFAAYLLAPKPGKVGTPKVTTKDIDGQSIIRGDSYAAKNGFNSAQNIVELGSIVPMVYAKREIIDGIAYGSVRVNTDLLWSQMLSLGGNQLFRGMFLIGQGGIEEIDAEQIAIGNNLLTGYGLSIGGQLSSKVSLYANLGGGRLTSASHIAGVPADQDDGNSERAGAPDIYCVQDASNQLAQDFSYTSKPSSQTAFGLYAPIGSCLSYRVNPSFNPGTQIFLQPADSGQKYRVKCELDAQERVQRIKYQTAFHGRVSFPGKPDGAFAMTVGEEVLMLLDSDSDANHVFTYSSNGPDGNIKCEDVAQAIAGRQNGYDDALVVGERYLIGSALAVCVNRSENAFLSEVENNTFSKGAPVEARFRVLSAGVATNKIVYPSLSATAPYDRPLLTATGRAQTFKIAIASVTLERKAQVIEVGIRSTLGISINGLCNFSTTWSFSKVDSEYCDRYQNEERDSQDPFSSNRFQSGVLSLSETRYSFWKLLYRRSGTGDDFIECSELIGTSSVTQQPAYNYIRIVFPGSDNWEYQFMPVSGWEVRNSGRALELLDFRAPVRTIQTAGLLLSFNGKSIPNTQDMFRSNLFDNSEPLGINSNEGSYVDSWGKLAEIFIYNEIQSSVTSGPEHEIAYVNIFSPQELVPQFDALAILGMSLRAGPEVRELGQVSIPVLRGLKGTHLFPEILADMFTNPDYASRGILSPEQIDWDSFAEAADWNYKRRYFCDLAQAEPINRREWGQSIAPQFLLDLVTRNGKLILQPSFYMDKPEPITALFTAGNIAEDSFTYRTTDTEAQQPVRVSVKWRQERESTTLGERALFPVIREVTIARAGTPGNARVSRIDLSDFCTSEAHAIDVAKLECLTPELSRSSVSFRTWPHAGAIVPGRCFQLGMESIRYESPANGVIGLDGTVVTWPPLADGTYDVALWRAGGNEIEELTIRIANGLSSPAGAVFCLRVVSEQLLTYKAVRVALNEEAEVEVEGIEFPCDENGISLYAKEFDDPNGWEIDGKL